MLNSVPTSPSIPRVPVTFEIIISDQHFSVGFFGLFGPLFRYFCLRSEFGLGKRSNVGIFEMDLFECDYECWMYYYHKWVWKSVSDLQRLYLYLYLYFCWDLELEPQWEWRGQAPGGGGGGMGIAGAPWLGWDMGRDHDGYLRMDFAWLGNWEGLC